jgi:hypothetical protein
MPNPLKVQAVHGRSTAAGVSVPVQWLAFRATGNGDTTLLSAVAGKRIRILCVSFACEAAMTVGWKTGNTLRIQPMSFGANGGVDTNRQPYSWWMETNVGDALILNKSTTSAVVGSLNYIVF